MDCMFSMVIPEKKKKDNKKKNNSNKAKAKQEAKNATIQEELNNQKSVYNDAIETQDSINKYVFIVNVQSDYEAESYEERHLSILREGSEIVSWELSGNDTVEKYNEFEQTLENYIVSFPENPVLLCLNENDDNILYRDEQKILEIFSSLSDKYTNVYIRSSIDKESK